MNTLKNGLAAEDYNERAKQVDEFAANMKASDLSEIKRGLKHVSGVCLSDIQLQEYYNPPGDGEMSRTRTFAIIKKDIANLKNGKIAENLAYAFAFELPLK